MKKQLYIFLFFIATVVIKAQPTCTLIITYTPPTAFGLCNASASVTAVTGNTLFCPPTYTWVPFGNTGWTVSNLCAGVYSVYAAFGGGTVCCAQTVSTVVIPNGPTGINEHNSITASFFYDNTNGVLHVNNVNKTIRSLKIFDLSGKEIKNILIENNSQEINLSELHPGIYFIDLYSEFTLTERQKLCVISSP